MAERGICKERSDGLANDRVSVTISVYQIKESVTFSLLPITYYLRQNRQVKSEEVKSKIDKSFTSLVDFGGLVVIAFELLIFF